jgi:hypothetical protein
MIHFHLENLCRALRNQSSYITGEALAVEFESEENGERRLHHLLNSGELGDGAAEPGPSSVFPFVVLPEFEVNGQSVLGQATVERSIFCQFVLPSQLSEWQTFTDTNKHWIRRSYKIAAMSGESHEKLHSHDPGHADYMRWTKILDTGHVNISISSDVYTGDTANEAQVPVNVNFESGRHFCPWWYQTPPPKASEYNPGGILQVPNINMDLLSSYSVVAELYDTLLQAPEASYVTSDIVNDSFFHETDDGKPRSVIAYPVHQKLYNSYLDETMRGEGHNESMVEAGADQLAGMLVVSIEWGSFVDDLLPEGLSNVLIVVRSSCGGLASFLLNGPKVSFLSVVFSLAKGFWQQCESGDRQNLLIALLMSHCRRLT